MRSKNINKGHERDDQPYERFLELGPMSLTNAELIAIMLRTGTVGENATELSKRILSLHQGNGNKLSVLHELTMKDLMEIHGIGQVKAVRILALSELTKRISGESATELPILSNPKDIASRYMERMCHEKKENVWLLLLNTKLALMHEELLFIGTVNCAMISVREIFALAASKNAVHVVLLHNHPSGDPTPSKEDIKITTQVAQAGKLMEIPLVDHIIIGNKIFISMKEQGYI